MIRPEPLSLFYLFLAYLICLAACKEKYISLKGFLGVFLAVGFCFSYALFSKIQVAPAVMMLFVMIAVYLWIKNKSGDLIVSGHKGALAGLGIGIMNMIVFPWWALKRPVYLTDEYLRWVNGIYVNEVFGTAPENLVMFPLLILGVVLLISAGIYFSIRRENQISIGQRAFPVVLALNCMITGSILGSYTVFLPVSRSLAMYVGNTNNMVYGMIANSTFGGWLLHRTLNFQSFQNIYDHLQQNGSFLDINLLMIVLLIGVWSLFRLFRQEAAVRKNYLLVFFWMFLGLLFDILAMLRAEEYFDYYAIYSVTFYGVAIVHFLALELDLIKCTARWKRAYQLAFVIICCLLTAHAAMRIVYMLNLPKANGRSDQDPAIEFDLTKWLGQPYWHLVNQGIEKNNESKHPVTVRLP